MGNSAQCRTVRRTLEVVIDHLRDHGGIELIPQSRDQLGQFLRSEDVEQHEDVCLFRGLVVDRRVSLCLEYEIQTADVPVS